MDGRPRSEHRGISHEHRCRQRAPSTGMSTIAPSRLTLMEPPPRCLGQLIRNVVSYATLTALPSRSPASVSSRLEVIRPSQPPEAPAQSEPGRKSRQPSACQPDRSSVSLHSSVATTRTGPRRLRSWFPLITSLWMPGKIAWA